jgi:polar amino acid transport system substrate-binding protein
MYQPSERSDWLEKSNVTCANLTTTIYVGYSKSLATRAPTVAQFLKQVNFDVETLYDWILKISERSGGNGRKRAGMNRREAYRHCSGLDAGVSEAPQVVTMWRITQPKQEKTMKKLFALLLLMFSLPLFAQSVDDLTFVTEEYAPYNFEKNGKVQGISVDTLVEMLKIAGSKKVREDIKVWPWARAYDTTLKEKNMVLFSTNRTEAREKLFKWVGPIVPSRIVLMAKKSKGIKIPAIEDVNKSNYKIGAVREDVGEQTLLKLGVKADKIQQNNSGLNVAKMLQSDRIDMWAYGEDVALWNLKELGFPTKDYEPVYTLMESKLYYAFNKDTDDKAIAKLQAALDQLKASGKFKQIMAAYQ